MQPGQQEAQPVDSDRPTVSCGGVGPAVAVPGSRLPYTVSLEQEGCRVDAQCCSVATCQRPSPSSSRRSAWKRLSVLRCPTLTIIVSGSSSRSSV